MITSSTNENLTVDCRTMLPHYDERTDRPILPKEELVDGAYYVGRCRNATVARWSAKRGSFFHWRVKFSRIYVEEIKHPIDEEYFDVFRVVRHLADPKFEIPFDVASVFQGRVEDLDEYSHEMWSKPVP
jgi:hypothetical protein